MQNTLTRPSHCAPYKFKLPSNKDFACYETLMDIVSISKPEVPGHLGKLSLLTIPL